MAMRHWLQLSLTKGLGPVLQSRLVEACGSAQAACAVTPAELRGITGIGGQKAAEVSAGLKDAERQMDEQIARAQSAGAMILSRDDADYPALLKHIPDPPAVLFIRGSLQPRDLNSVAIVGSRRCSYYGREQAERFGALLAGAGIIVTSGGARGIDSAAHRGALSHPQGRTIAVLGSGVDVAYPAENEKLFAQIAERGVVMSEYPMGTPPLAENFPRRNRIVSGLSRAVLVIEADIRSGALITARQAGDDHGRPVLALPGRVDNALSAGPHKLIRDGATLVTSLQEIVESLGPLPHDIVQPELFMPIFQEADSTVVPNAKLPATASKLAIDLTDSQKQILLKIGDDTLDVDSIIERTALPAHLVLQELTLLSLKGAVRRVDGQNYARGKMSL